MSNSFLSLHETGVCLTVRAKPGLARARAPKCVTLADGQQALEIAVAAPPEDGKANKALIAFLADTLRLRRKQISLKSGLTGRLKVFHIDGDPSTLKKQIEAWGKGLEKNQK